MAQGDVKQEVGNLHFYCDMCAQRGMKLEIATYEAKTKFGSWAYMCDDCFKKWGIGLGIGKGFKIIKEATDD